jgi:uncharacterized repeat protein (TIGR02543 family)
MYTLDVNIQPANSGSVDVFPTTADYEEGTEVMLTPSPNSGYKFDAWTGPDASEVSSNKIVMDKDMTITANFDLMNMIRLKTGTGLNPGATINFVALSKNVNYFDLTTDEKFDYDKTSADWYIDGGIIPFTTDYKEFDLDAGEYYFMLRAVGLVMITTIDVVDGKQTMEIYSVGYGVSVRITADTKGAVIQEEIPSKKEIIRR